MSVEAREAIENSKRKRTRLQAQSGEVMTNADVVEGLRMEGEVRSSQKKKGKNETKKNKVVEEEQETQQPCSSKSRKKRVPTSPKLNIKSSESDNDDDTKCKFCKHFVNEAGHELKVKSTIFGEYATSAITTSAPRCVPRGFDVADDFFCKDYSWHLE